MEKQKVQDIIENGGFLTRTVCEILGRPKEHVEETMNQLVDSIGKKEDFTLMNHEIMPCVEQGKLFSTFVEMEILFKNKEAILGFCFDFMPSSVEILEPTKVEMPNDIFSAWINELQAKLHNVDMIAKERHEFSKIVKREQAHLIRFNLLSHLIDEPLTRKELNKRIGVDKEMFSKFINTLKERNEIIEEGDKIKLHTRVQFKDEPEKSS
ncbi:hypothetical protein COU54_00480 [Candidatus Pacearchaeota archaeon CG10_big_fil_rev_8_21_14_0_10_31_24]|nr:MAG: hypothetical protein COU54_00480 [Candidatus Pacearchaeota archaeon CG10_big_fil_rev_8_21_14_0_10_31_24]